MPGTDVEESFKKSDSEIVEDSLNETDNNTEKSYQVESSQIENHDDTSSDEESEKNFKVNRRKSRMYNRIDSDSESSEDEQQKIKQERRRTFYIEHPDGDEDVVVEEQAFSKTTRKSMGFMQIKEEPRDHESNSDSSDDDVIEVDDDSDEDKYEEKFQPPAEKSNNSILTSTMHSRDDDIDESSDKENSQSFQDEKVKVSRSMYAVALSEKDTIENRLSAVLKMSNPALMANLPDGGEKLKDKLNSLKSELEEKKKEISKMVIDDQESITNRLKNSIKEEEKTHSFNESSQMSIPELSENAYLKVDDVQPKHTGKIGMKNFEIQKALTEDKLQEIHQSLNQRPPDDAEAKPPKHLKVNLMKHQLQALRFMEWRENQSPRGGILADDMGLGKTLTAISLIMLQIQKYEELPSDAEESEDEERSEWIAQGRRDLRAGGTLIICPATLMNQWNREIETRVKRGALDVCVFHGTKRPTSARQLAKFDVVITTYQIVVSEHKNDGCIFDLRWDRIFLDEGHVIRNYKSKQSEAVCAIEAKRRWVMTGTPVQNKEFDLFATVKFLRCIPFSDLRYWKTWIETRGGGVSQRLHALLKSILLRRTKQQLIEGGELEELPSKEVELVKVKLNPSERFIYGKVMSYSTLVFAQFVEQSKDKFQYQYEMNGLKNLYNKFRKMHGNDREIQAHEILTLLLRLRQICCHCGLMKVLLEKMDDDGNELSVSLTESNANDSDHQMLKKLQGLKIDEEEGSVVDGMLKNISLDDPVFNFDVASSKVEAVMEQIEKYIIGTDNKAIVVSQWTGVLDIVKGMLEVSGVGYCELNGKVPVQKRNDIVVNFNKADTRERIMLLSITAGGVGLNLVGANYLIIMDPHW